MKKNTSASLRKNSREFLPALYRAYDLFRRYSRSRLPAPTHQEAALIFELQTTLKSLAPVGKAKPTDSEGVASFLRNQVRQLFTTRDPRAFLQWSYIRWSLYNPGPLTEEIEYLMQSEGWRDRWSHALQEAKIGVPDQCPLYPATSWNLTHHAYAVSYFERTVGKKVESLGNVVEFGGGYGSMCRLFHNLGFTGNYFIYDFPELSALQRYFLKSIGLKVGGPANQGIQFVNNLQDIAFLSQQNKLDLFVATWSLSETPFAFRESVLKNHPAKHYLIGYQEKYFGLDNVEFFAKFTKTRPDLKWNDWPITHSPGTRYLSGSPR